MMLQFICSFLIIGSISGLKLPSELKKCSVKDLPCLKEAIQDALPKLKKGFPEIGLPPLEPIDIPLMEIKDFANVVKLVQTYKNAKFSGVADSKIDKMIFDLDKGNIGFDTFTPLFLLNATYEANGTLLVLPIYGTGKCLIKLEDVKSTILFKVEIYTKDNEKYIRGTHGDMSMDIKHATLRFDNLFDGDPVLGENMNKVLNDNWKPILDETIAEYCKVYAEYIMRTMNRILEKIPISELFLN